MWLWRYDCSNGGSIFVHNSDSNGEEYLEGVLSLVMAIASYFPHFRIPLLFSFPGAFHACKLFVRLMQYITNYEKFS